MATLFLTAQDVNGDPLVSGGNINIVNGSTTGLTFTDTDFQLASPQTAEYVSLDGGVTQLTYTFLGYGDVRHDTLQHAAFIRVLMPNGTYKTFAIDMNADGDALPDLATGNTKLTVAGLDSTSSERFPAPACFTPGTLIETDSGERTVESLRPGDLVRTMDHGFQPLRRVLSQTLPAQGHLAPIRFEAGELGNRRVLVVSPQHRMLIADWRAGYFFGEPEVFVAALHLVNGTTVTRQCGGMVTYMHLVFDRHEVVYSEGIPSESLFPEQSGKPDSAKSTAEIVELFPMAGRQRAQIARPQIRAREARLVAV